MCNKFSVNTSLNDLWTNLPLSRSDRYILPLAYNVVSGEKAPVVYIDETEIKIKMMEWGLIPILHSLENKIRFINAEIETINNKSFFHNLIDQKKCLIPMSGFYVWDNKVSPQVPYYFYLPYRELFMVAGIWNITKINNQFTYTFSLLTKEADANVGCINKRMPVIVTPANHQSWLKNAEFGIANFLSAPPLYFYKLGNNAVPQYRNDHISLA